MRAGAERRASLETDVQGNISPQETVRVLTLKANPVSKTTYPYLGAHDDCISSRQGSGGKEDRTNSVRAAAQHRARRRWVRLARFYWKYNSRDCLQACVCLGLQWLLPPGPGESERYVESSGCSPGKSRVTFVTGIWAHNILVRTKFAGPNKQYLAAKVSAGPSNSVVIDRQGMYYVAGKVSFRVIYCQQALTLPNSVEKHG